MEFPLIQMKMHFNEILEKTGDYVEKGRKSRLELKKVYFERFFKSA